MATSHPCGRLAHLYVVHFSVEVGAPSFEAIPNLRAPDGTLQLIRVYIFSTLDFKNTCNKFVDSFDD